MVRWKRLFMALLFFQAEDGIRDSETLLEFRRVLFRSVVTNSRSRPSSLKKPLSRATSTGRSCTAFMVATWGLVLSLTVMMRSPMWTVNSLGLTARYVGDDDPSTSARLSTTKGLQQHSQPAPSCTASA